ncbi:MAG: hypothetical protein IT537_04585 [Hyphomicrobiales bacterium]|nr:hypothetical protein [Hyphomicrobiales bacterium]
MAKFFRRNDFETDPGGTTGQHAIDFAVVNALKSLHVAGGNLWIKRAIAVSTATTLAQLSGEIKIAEDYGRYLANKDLIDTLIALNPTSASATSSRASRRGVRCRPCSGAGRSSCWRCRQRIFAGGSGRASGRSPPCLCSRARIERASLPPRFEGPASPRSPTRPSRHGL